MENLLVVDNEGLEDDMTIIHTTGNFNFDLLSSTIANNFGKPVQVLHSTVTFVVQNSILQQNSSSPLVSNSVSFISLCNNSQLASASGQSFGPNLGDPQFTSTSRGDYRLAETSPSIDNCSFGSEIDLDGNTRPNDNSNYDQGAFEKDASIFLDLIFESRFEVLVE